MSLPTDGNPTYIKMEEGAEHSISCMTVVVSRNTYVDPGGGGVSSCVTRAAIEANCAVLWPSKCWRTGHQNRGTTQFIVGNLVLVSSKYLLRHLGLGFIVRHRSGFARSRVTCVWRISDVRSARQVRSHHNCTTRRDLTHHMWQCSRQTFW